MRHLPDAYGFLVNRGRHDQSAFLDSIFQETRDVGPEHEQVLIGRFVRSLAAPDTSGMTWEEVRPKLAPLLRTPTTFGCSPEMTPDKRPIQRPFAPFLIECVGVDSDDGIAYVFAQVLDRWGVTVAEVFEAATENGHAYFTDDVEPYDAQAPYPIWHVARDDSYESSRLLVPGWSASFEGKVKGRPVAIVPHRSLLIVGGDGDERCLRRLIDSAQGEFEASPRRISPALYATDADGKVVPFRLRSGHPLAGDVAVGHHLAAMAEYNGQKASLDEHLKEDVYVATYTAARDQSGGAFSCSVWSKGAPTLLPETDHVALNLAPGQQGAEIHPRPLESPPGSGGERPRQGTAARPTAMADRGVARRREDRTPAHDGGPLTGRRPMALERTVASGRGASSRASSAPARDAPPPSLPQPSRNRRPRVQRFDLAQQGALSTVPASTPRLIHFSSIFVQVS